MSNDNSWPAEPFMPLAMTAYDVEPVTAQVVDLSGSEAWMTPGLILLKHSDGTAEVKPSPPAPSTKVIDDWWKKKWGKAPRGVKVWPPVRQPWQLPE